MRKHLPLLIALTLIFSFGTFFFQKSQNASAVSVESVISHLVISEVQLAGATAGSDFIEIYNPTSSEISLEGLRLAKRTSGSTSASIVAFDSDESVPAHGYFLWCNTTLNASLSCDKNTSETVANNNSIAILNGPLATGSVVDAVSFGTPSAPFGEGTSLTAPIASSSVERKANASSTSITMAPGGIDETMGNGEDTNSNSVDFVTRLNSQPQNSASIVEIPNNPSIAPTPSVSPIPTTILSPTITPTPSLTPSVTPSITTSITPTMSPSPSPTASPTMSPIPSASPTLSPVPTATPTLTPTPSILTPRVISRGPLFTCSITYKPWKLFNRTIFFPTMSCIRK